MADCLSRWPIRCISHFLSIIRHCIIFLSLHISLSHFYLPYFDHFAHFCSFFVHFPFIKHCSSHEYTYLRHIICLLFVLFSFQLFFFFFRFDNILHSFSLNLFKCVWIFLFSLHFLFCFSFIPQQFSIWSTPLVSFTLHKITLASLHPFCFDFDLLCVCVQHSLYTHSVR